MNRKRTGLGARYQKIFLKIWKRKKRFLITPWVVNYCNGETVEGRKELERAALKVTKRRQAASAVIIPYY